MSTIEYKDVDYEEVFITKLPSYGLGCVDCSKVFHLGEVYIRYPTGRIIVDPPKHGFPHITKQEFDSFEIICVKCVEKRLKK